jgi:hypothetical protein
LGRSDHQGVRDSDENPAFYQKRRGGRGGVLKIKKLWRKSEKNVGGYEVASRYISSVKIRMPEGEARLM